MKYSFKNLILDNVATRYLLNDASYLLGKPLVSGAALRWDGQVTVYIPGKGCYRCTHPKPPTNVTNCSEGGVLGPIVGMIGSIQALEAIKVVTNVEKAMSGKMIIYDGLRGETRNIKMRGQKPDCKLCGTKEITQLVDYVQFCQSGAHDKDIDLDLLESSQRISPKEMHKSHSKSLIIDVR